MGAKSSLKNREFGFELSGTEYTLIFEKENIGFVRFDSKAKMHFYLDPSPFFESPKREVYVLENCVPPNNGDLIEVITLESDSFIDGSYGNYQRTKIKYVHNWKKLSPNTFIRSKAMHPEEYIDFFNRPFSGAPEYMEQLSFCLALCTMSSPSIGSNGKGGIDSGIFAKKDSWGPFKRLMDLVPSDFRKTSSKYYFDQFDKEKVINPLKSEEINIATLNPLEVPVHIPITLDTGVKRVNNYKDDIMYEIPFLRAYLLDSLMFRPEATSKKVESHLIDLIDDMVEEFTHAKSISYSQDLGSAAPKLCSAFARLKLTEKISKNDVDECGAIWMDMFHYSIRTANSNLAPEELFKLTPHAFKLYRELEDKYGVDKHIPISAISEITSINQWEKEEALATLKKIGSIYSPSNQFIRLIDFKF